MPQGVIATIPKFQFSANGIPLVGGSLTVYIAGSTTPTNTWQDSALTVANTNPITLDSRGECVLWLDSTVIYKFILKNALGVVQWTQDNINSQALLRTDLSSPGGATLIGANAYQTQDDVNSERVSAKAFGATGDGVTDDAAAIQAALASGASKVHLPAGHYIVKETLVIPQGVTLCGDGVDYWDTYRPDPATLIKSDAKGTHLYFSGTGAKTYSAANLTNARAAKTVSGKVYELTHFTNQDSANGNPATPKLFSVGIVLNKDAGLQDLRLLPSFNGLAGYKDAALLTLADDWDVGIWAISPNDARIHNVQGVGYWRMASLMFTENDGNFNTKGNSERFNVTKYMGQGRRGLLIRNAPQIHVLSNTTTTITVRYNSSCRFSASNQFRIVGSGELFTYTAKALSGSDLVLSGVTPNLPAGVTVLRAPNIGNGLSASVFNDCLFASLDHTSGQPSSFFGLGEAGAFEADGFPLRSVTMNNTKFQTTHDTLNGIFGDVRDWKIVNGQYENGVLIAYNIAEDNGFTENLRMLNTEISGTVNRTEFNPREAFIDHEQFPTQFTDGSNIWKPWRDVDTSIQDFAGTKLLDHQSSNDSLVMKNGTGQEFLRSNGATGEATLTGANISLKNTAGAALLTIFGTSNNATFAGNVSPGTDNAKSLGGASFRWTQLFAGSATISTSDMREKQKIELLTDAERAVALRLKGLIRTFRFNDAVAAKGEQARIHCGVMAQSVQVAFEAEGLNAEHYAMLCYDEWPDEFDEDGVQTQKAGNRYGVRYEELLAFIIGGL